MFYESSEDRFADPVPGSKMWEAPGSTPQVGLGNGRIMIQDDTRHALTIFKPFVAGGYGPTNSPFSIRSKQVVSCSARLYSRLYRRGLRSSWRKPTHHWFAHPAGAAARRLLWGRSKSSGANISKKHGTLKEIAVMESHRY